VAVFQTRDGYVYVAVGNDAQWAALAKLPAFAGLDRPAWAANAGRIADAERLHRELGERVARLPTAEAQALLREAGVPISRVNTLADVVADPLVAPRLVHVRDPRTGLTVALPAPPVGHSPSCARRSRGRAPRRRPSTSTSRSAGFRSSASAPKRRRRSTCRAWRRASSSPRTRSRSPAPARTRRASGPPRCGGVTTTS